LRLKKELGAAARLNGIDGQAFGTAGGLRMSLDIMRYIFLYKDTNYKIVLCKFQGENKFCTNLCQYYKL
jgi:hypothetical protein